MFCGNYALHISWPSSGTTRPTIDEYFPMMNQIERIMMGMNKLLSYDGRLILVNSVLTALPTFYLCTLKIPQGAIDHVDKYKKHTPLG